MRGVAVGLLLAASGCLTTPRPGGGDDDVIDAATDAAPARCSGARPAGTTWPPEPSNPVRVRDLQVVDVDVDGRDDLVLVLAPARTGDPQRSAVHVMFGPLAPTGPYVSHAIVDVADLASIAAWGVAVEDLDGDQCPELTVTGPPMAAGGPSRVAVWKHQATIPPWSGVPLRQPLASEPFSDMHVVFADLTAEPGRDLVTGSYNGQLMMFAGVTATRLLAGQEITPPTCGWDYANHLRAAPRPGGGERLFVFGRKRWNTVDVDAGGVARASEHCTDVDDDQVLVGTSIDLDGVAPPDVLGGGTSQVILYKLAGDAAPALVPMPVANCGARGPDFYSEGIATGQLGGGPEPDVVVLDVDDRVGVDLTSYLCLLDDVSATATRLDRAALTETTGSEDRTRAIAIGDLTAAPGNEVWAVDEGGALRCWRRGTTPTLEPC